MGACELVSAFRHRERYRLRVFDGVKGVKGIVVFVVELD